MATQINENNQTEMTVKDWLKVTSDFMGATAEDLVKYAKETYNQDINIDDAKGYFKGKSIVLDMTLNWDSNKSYDENIANISGVIAEGLAVGIIATGVTPALVGVIGIAIVGVGITIGLKELNLDLGQIAESLYKELKMSMEHALNKQNSLTQDDRTNLAQMINAGGLPWNYNSQQAQQAIRVYDPLALDLNHNGKIDTTNANSSNTFFDMDSNGMSEITGWIDKEDGLLVYDKNNNGKIDNINELFGNKNKDGYRELRELINSNDDNVIDKNDTKFKDLKIWQDLNGDGISQNNELKTLDELNITSINLNSKNTNIDDNGNNIFKTSTFTQNGQEYLSGDVNFAVDKRFTDFRGDYSLSVDALFLPWLRGYGDVKDAHIAYSMDEERKVA